MSRTYMAALAKNDAAIRAFRVIQNAYRGRAIRDEEFLAGKRRYEAAMQEYDQAFALAKGVE